MQRLGHGPEHLAQAGCLGRRGAQGIGDLLGVQAQQPPHRGGGAKRAGRARDVEALIVVLRMDREGNPGRHLESDHVGRQQVPPRSADVLGSWKGRGQHGACAVDHRGIVGVVEVQDVRGDPVDRRGVDERRPPTTEEGGLWIAAELIRHLASDAHGRLVPGAERNAQVVQ